MTFARTIGCREACRQLSVRFGLILNAQFLLSGEVVLAHMSESPEVECGDTEPFCGVAGSDR